MYSVSNVDLFLLADIRIFGRITDCEKTSEFVSFRGMDGLLYVFRFVTMGMRNAHASPSAVAASRMFSTAAHAEAK